MRPFVIVTGDFVKTGGMDRPNFALADYLSRQHAAVSHPTQPSIHLVAHRVAPELQTHAQVAFYPTPKPANSYFLGSFLLNQRGKKIAQQVAQQGGRVVVNGGNCHWGDINWVHYVHAAYTPNSAVDRLRALKQQVERHISLADERKALQAAKVVIVNSNRTRQDLIQLVGVDPAKIYTCYYGIDPGVFHPATSQQRQHLRQQFGWDAQTPIVLFIGALGDRRKGFDTLFAAWQQLCQQPSWDANLVVIGRGAELPLWEERVASAGLAERICFLGFRNDVPDLLRAADCLVAPTRYEAYGLGVHEAICCGLPAIVSADAGVAERYSKALEQLLLQDPNHVEELAERLQAWRNQAETTHTAIQELGNMFHTHTWDRMAQQILGICGETDIQPGYTCLDRMATAGIPL